MSQVVALLDRPNPKSFGRVAFITRNSRGVLHTHGLPRNHVLHEEDVQALVEDGHAVLLCPEVPIHDVPEDFVAGWLGDRFADYIRGVPHGPPLPAVPAGSHHVPQGTFWIGRLTEVTSVVLDWIQRAARCVIAPGEMSGTDRAYLAGLMSWALPSADETKAARLYVQVTPEARAQEIDLLLRMEREAGRLTIRFDPNSTRVSTRSSSSTGPTAPERTPPRRRPPRSALPASTG